ncbi:MAG: tetratricopeptide repeat protein, partial [Cyanobacteria bacterium P01_F01_bin.143]
YEKALDIKPDYHEAWYNRGNALSDLGRLEEAIASHDQALKIKPDYHEAWNNRGIALKNLGRLEEAIASHDQALKIKPDGYRAWGNRGNALFNLGRYEEAITSYKQVLNIKPDEYLAWYKIACIYSIQNEIGLALQNLKEAILLNKKYCNMAKKNSDFDNIRQDVRFQKLLEKYSPEN